METVSSPVAPRGLSAWLSQGAAWLDARGKPAWIVAMVLAFIFVWPVGLALLAYMIWSKRMFNRSHCAHRRDRRSHQMEFSRAFSTSGNTAFDSYKAEMLKRLETEQTAFETFLQRLRDAKDKSEFDAFMEDRAKTNSGEAPEAARPGDY